MKRAICLSSLLAAACLLFPTWCRGAEEYERFLEALRRNELYDVALEYLEQMRDSPLIPQETKETITFEQGQVLVEQSRVIRDIPIRQKKIDEALAKLKQFLADSPEHRQAAMANTQLANVLIEQGRTMLERAKLPSQAANKDALIKTARAALEDSLKRFEAAEGEFLKKVEMYPKGELGDQALTDARQKARLDLIQSRLYTARAAEEIAKSYEKGTPEFKKAMEAAIAKYREVAEKYRAWVAGLYAVMYLGNCHYQMGNMQEALSWYNQLLAEENPDLRELQIKTLRLAMLCWTDAKEKKYEEALKNGAKFLESVRPDEESSPEGLAIAWLHGVALEQQIEATKAEEKAANAARKKIRDHIKRVAQFQGDYQKDARDWLAKHAGIETAEVAGFAEAYDAARAAIQASQTKTDPKEKRETLAKALELLDATLKYREADTPIEQINQVRYFQCFVHYQLGRYYETAVLGDFLAHRYADASTARPAAYLSLVGWLAASKLASEPDFENAQLKEAANYITKKWPGDKESDQAVILLVEQYTAASKLNDALEVLTKIPLESPRRAEAELKAGQALWTHYLNKVNLPDDRRPKKADLDDIFAKAENTLKAGIDRLRKGVEEGGEVTYALLAAELSLAQIYLDSSKADSAMAVITRPKGTLELVKAKSEVTNLGNFREETYKAALRAFVGTQKLPEAEAVMKELEGVTANEDVLTKIYISLGKSLEAQIETLQAQKDEAALKTVRQGFELFLDRISQRPGNTYSSLYWVASTYRGMASGLAENRTQQDAAKSYFQKAADTFTKMRADLPKLVSDEAKREAVDVALRIRLAEMLRRGGKPDEALKILVPLVKERPRSLEAQMESASAYQALGEVDPANYAKALVGDIDIKDEDGNPAKAVWGWDKLYAMLSRLPQFAEVAYECQYNQYQTRILYGLSQTDPRKKASWINSVKKGIDLKVQFGSKFPSRWVRRFDNLLAQVNTALGQKHVPLAELIDKAEKEKARAEQKDPAGGKSGAGAKPGAGASGS